MPPSVFSEIGVGGAGDSFDMSRECNDATFNIAHDLFLSFVFQKNGSNMAFITDFHSKFVSEFYFPEPLFGLQVSIWHSKQILHHCASLDKVDAELVIPSSPSRDDNLLSRLLAHFHRRAKILHAVAVHIAN